MNMLPSTEIVKNCFIMIFVLHKTNKMWLTWISTEIVWNKKLNWLGTTNGIEFSQPHELLRKKTLSNTKVRFRNFIENSGCWSSPRPRRPSLGSSLRHSPRSWSRIPAWSRSSGWRSWPGVPRSEACSGRRRTWTCTGRTSKGRSSRAGTGIFRSFV